MSKVGSLIRSARKQSGCTMAMIAATTGRSVSHLKDIEIGKLQGTPETLRAVACVLGIDVDTLRDAYVQDATDVAMVVWTAKPRQSVMNKRREIRSIVT